ANDMGSLMIEENVVASAGTVHYLTLEQIKNAIRELGYIPRQRNVFYEYIDEGPPAPATPSAPVADRSLPVLNARTSPNPLPQSNGRRRPPRAPLPQRPRGAGPGRGRCLLHRRAG